MTDIVIFTDTSRPGIWLRGIGPYSLASTLRQKGYTVEVIDFISAIPYDDFHNICKKYLTNDTKIVGISTTWISSPGKFTTDLKSSYSKKKMRSNQGFFDADIHHEYYDSFSWALTSNSHHRFIELIRKYATLAKVIIGGARAIDFDDNVSYDHVLLGYAENELLDLLKNDKEYPYIINHDVKGEIGDYRFNESQTLYTQNDFLMEDETLAIEIGRGCVFKCKYCSFPLIGKKKLSYMKDLNLLRDELLRNWENYKINRYIISDDTFNDSTEKLEVLASLVESLPFKLDFWCFARLDMLAVKFEQAELMKRIGLREVQFGVESFNPASAHAVGKGMGADKKKEALYKLKELWGDSIHIKCSFIIGLPYETTASLQETFDWLSQDDCPIDMVGVNPFFIFKPDEKQHLRWNSELDLKYADYGYHFKDSLHVFDWKKDDDTDIKSFNQCIEITEQWKSVLDNKTKGITDVFYYANCKSLEMNFEEMFSKHTIEEITKDKDWKRAYLDQVKTCYINKKLGL
jgi:radical SAM superfamily enzyme YgiQ (UPF0313 family)